jgi:putative spermidine/putrescine transport system permease protein
MASAPGGGVAGPGGRGRALLAAYVGAFTAFMLAPLVVVAGASFEPMELLRFPPEGLSLRWYRRMLDNELLVGAAWNSLLIAALATAGAFLLGVPAAYGMARWRFRGRELVAGLLNSPLLVPELVMGLALLQILAVIGIGSSVAVLTLGHVLICLPYVVRTMQAAIVGVDPSIEEAAASLGAGQLKIYLTILLPMVAPALGAALLFAFLISFDNTVLSLFLVSARTTTLPISIYKIGRAHV